MSIQAVAWVLSQKGEDLPGIARLVMIALANHADHTNGHCWPSMPTIANEAGCSERTASRYIYALERNGFIDVRRTARKGGQFRSNDYWIMFERPSAQWQFHTRDEAEDVHEDEPSANLSDGQDGTENTDLADGPSDTVGIRQESLLEPSESEPSAPTGFDPTARTEQRAKLQAADEARKLQRIPVIEGSKPWESWVRHGHSRNLVNNISLNGRIHRGWWFPSLYPPKQSTGPPPLSALMTSEDEQAI